MSDDDQPTDGDPTDNQNIRNLREQAKRARQLEEDLAARDAQIADLVRKDAFRTAGIDPADSKAKYFVKAYDGEMTADAIRAEAEAAGLLGQPAPAPEPVPTGELDAFDRFSQAAAGGQSGQADTTYLDELHDGMSPQEIAIVLAKHGQPVSDMGQYAPNEGSLLR